MRVRHPFRPAALLTAAVTSLLTIGLAAPAAQASAGTTTGASAVRVRVAEKAARTVLTTAHRPVGVLRDADVELTPHDKVLLIRNHRQIRARANKDIRTGDTVKVVRIGRHVSFKRHAIKRHTVVRKTTKLAPGHRKVVRPGHRGVRRAKIVRWTRNGHHLRTDVSRRVVKSPAPRRVLVGVRARTVAGTGHLHWKALANCESGGNPRAVNPSGYYGLYQFSVGTWRSVGGQGMPNHASPGEQTYRAQRLYQQRGRSPWPNCGRYL